MHIGGGHNHQDHQNQNQGRSNYTQQNPRDNFMSENSSNDGNFNGNRFQTPNYNQMQNMNQPSMQPSSTYHQQRQGHSHQVQPNQYLVNIEDEEIKYNI
jgi:hypothetical protein